MQDAKAENLEFAPELIDGLFPYAVLEVSNVFESRLSQTARIFDLQVTPSLSGEEFELTTITKNPNEHKLQTVTLLAAALLINKTQKNSRQTLSTRIDFLKDERGQVIQEPNSSLKFISGSLTVSPACQLFLTQAGFAMTPSQVDQTFLSQDLVRWAHGLLAIAQMELNKEDEPCSTSYQAL